MALSIPSQEDHLASLRKRRESQNLTSSRDQILSARGLTPTVQRAEQKGIFLPESTKQRISGTYSTTTPTRAVALDSTFKQAPTTQQTQAPQQQTYQGLINPTNVVSPFGPEGRLSAIQSQMNGFIDYARGQGFQINEATGEVVNPSPELINQFNQQFTTFTPQQSAANQVNQAVTGQIQPQLDILGQASQAAQAAQQQRIQALQGEQQARLDPLNQLAEARKAALQASTEARLAEARQQAQQASEQLATRFGFSGFGRSSQQFAGQADLTQQALNIENQIRTAQLLEQRKIEAELQGASQDVIDNINNQIAQQNANIQGLKTDLASQQAELKLKALEAGGAAREALFAQLGIGAEQVARANLEASAQAGFLLDENGQPILNNAGNLVALPEGVKQQFISATARQNAGVFNPFTGEFTPIAGAGRAGLLGGGGGGINPALGFDPNNAGVYEEIMARVARGDALDLLDAIKETDVASSGKNTVQLANEVLSYSQAKQQQLQQEAAQQPPAQPLIDPTSRVGIGIEGVKAIGDVAKRRVLNPIGQFFFGPTQ